MFIYSFVRTVKYLLCARHCARCGGYNNKTSKPTNQQKVMLLPSWISLHGERDIKQVITEINL